MYLYLRSCTSDDAMHGRVAGWSKFRANKGSSGFGVVMMVGAVQRKGERGERWDKYLHCVFS